MSKDAAVIRPARDGDIDRIVELRRLGTLRPDQEGIEQ